MMRYIGRGSAFSGMLLLVAVTVVGCNEKKCVDKSKPELDKCTARSDELQTQINTLKRQLAQALANPGTIKVDPSVLMIDGKPIRVASGREGTISQAQVVGTLRRNKGSLQPCYNRALKRNSSLHHRKLQLTLSMKVNPNGSPSGIQISPRYDAQMDDCMTKAIRRWKFPPFKGSPVGIESPVTFTPKQ